VYADICRGSSGWGVKRQWSCRFCRRWQFSVATSLETLNILYGLDDDDYDNNDNDDDDYC